MLAVCPSAWLSMAGIVTGSLNYLSYSFNESSCIKGSLEIPLISLVYGPVITSGGGQTLGRAAHSADSPCTMGLALARCKHTHLNTEGWRNINTQGCVNCVLQEGTGGNIDVIL